MEFSYISALGPDACRSDPSAPCYYLHLKRRALNGERNKLSGRELAFVGIFAPRPRDGWLQPGEIAALAPADELDASPVAADLELLQKLIAVGASEARLGFLG